MGHRTLVGAVGACAIALVASGCDERPGSPEAGVQRRDARRADVPGLPPPPNTIVPCRPAGDGEVRTLFQVGAGGSIAGAVTNGLSFEEIAVAYPTGPGGPEEVAIENVRSDGVPYDDGTSATPEHPRVASPSIASTFNATVVAYLHNAPAPFRAHVVIRPAGATDWSAPIPLSPEAARRVRVVASGTNALVFFSVDADGESPGHLERAVVAEDGTIVAPAAVVPGTEGVTGFAASALGARVSLVADVPSATGDGRTLVHRELGSDGAFGTAATPVADDRATVGQPAVLRNVPEDGSNDDVVLVAWTEFGAGLAPNVHLARIGDGAFEDVITRNDATGSDPALAPLLDEWFALFFRSHDRETVRGRVARPFRTGGLTIDDVFPLRSLSGPLAAAVAVDRWGVGLVWTEDTDGGSRVAYATTRCTDRQ